LPEREPHAAIYRRTEQLLDLLDNPDVWPLAYLRWELALLEDMGYALDLTKCVASGSVENLIYVSPKSECAVSRDAAGDWADRLLPLPDVLRGIGLAPDSEVLEGLQTTGHFLQVHLAANLGGRLLPEARARFVETFKRRL
jgi:DNA repair protein RecO (recombination protein O)